MTWTRALPLAAAGMLLATLTACIPTADTAPDLLDCQRQGEPCTLAEASPEALQLTHQLTQVAADYLGLGVEPSEVAAELAAMPEVVQAGWSEVGVFFRLDGAPPAWVMLEELDGRLVEGGWIETGATGAAATARTASIPGTSASGTSPPIRFSAVEAGSSDGIAGTPGEGKRALVASPYPFAGVAELGPMLAADRDFSQRGGSVAIRLRDGTIDPVAAIDVFRGWDAFDTILLRTHGGSSCERDDDGNLRRDAGGHAVGCRTVLSAGPVEGTLEEVVAAIGDVPGLVIVEKTRDIRQDLPLEEVVTQLREECLPAMRADPFGDGLLPCQQNYHPEHRPVQVGVTADFFATVYPGGLPDRFIALLGCTTLLLDDIASRLQGGDGVVLGYPMIVWADESSQESAELVQAMLRGVPATDALAGNASRQSTDDVGAPRLSHLGNESLRIRDVVALMGEQVELRDGAMVPLTTTPDGAPATELTVRVSRVGGRESAADFSPEIWVDGEVVVPEVTLQHEIDGEFFSDPVPVPLPDGFEPGDRFDAEVRVALPAGGQSRWRYDDLTAALTVRFTSHVWYDTGESAGEGVLVAEGPIEQSTDGWVASLPMRWDRATVTGLPPQCSLGEAHAVSRFVVRGGSLEDEQLTLLWGVDTGGPIQDRVEVECSGFSFGQGFGTTLGIGGMLVVHGEELTEDPIWTAEEFVPSDEPGVLLVHRMEGAEGEVRSVVTIEVLGGRG